MLALFLGVDGAATLRQRRCVPSLKQRAVIADDSTAASVE
jgi:hypothetical protein